MMAGLVPPGPMGCISRFIWTFQCLTLVLACRSFRWAAWEGWRRGMSPQPRTVGRSFSSLSKPGLEAPSGLEAQLTLL